MDEDKLWQMITEIETGDKLRAPSYLKREILAAAVQEAPTERPMPTAQEARTERLVPAAQETQTEHVTTTKQQAQAQHKPQTRKSCLRNTRLRKRLELIGYAIEVGAVTAAAVVLVLIAPFGEVGDMDDIRAESQWGIDSDTRRQISYEISEFTAKMVTWGDFLLPGEKEIESNQLEMFKEDER